MSQILIATKNQDKFRIVAALIKKIVAGRYSFTNLIESGTKEDIEEKGTIQERAANKAIYWWEYFKENNLLDGIIAPVGVDDGFGKSELSIGDPNSKDLTDKILSNRYIKPGETIWLKRAFAFYNDDVGLKSCLTSIPFIFLSNKLNIKREDGRDPLSYVLGIANHDKPVASLPFDETIEYYFQYSKGGLTKILKVLG